MSVIDWNGQRKKIMYVMNSNGQVWKLKKKKKIFFTAGRDGLSQPTPFFFFFRSFFLPLAVIDSNGQGFFSSFFLARFS